MQELTLHLTLFFFIWLIFLLWYATGRSLHNYSNKQQRNVQVRTDFQIQLHLVFLLDYIIFWCRTGDGRLAWGTAYLYLYLYKYKQYHGWVMMSGMSLAKLTPFLPVIRVAIDILVTHIFWDDNNSIVESTTEGTNQ